MTILFENSKVPEIGQCIYCGATDELSDEHAIPYALGGKLVLPKASCLECAKVTSGFEHTVLRELMLEGRTVGRFPTRHPRKRPSTFALKIKDSEGERTIELPPSEIPAFVWLPKMPPAGYLVGRELRSGMEVCGFEVVHFGKRPETVARQLGAAELTKHGSINGAIPRMLAKIGYCFAIAVRGCLPRDEVPVLPLILGHTFDASHWVGSAEFQTRPDQQGLLHTLDLGVKSLVGRNGTEELLVARIKLFAGSGATGYEVIVHRTDRAT